MESIIIQGESISLVYSKEEYIDYIIEAESDPHNAPYVFQWTKAQHIEAMENPDILHITIVENESFEKVGYAIVAGAKSPHKAIELMRVVISKKSHGYGRESLNLIKNLAFEILDAHRLWLDVKEYNYSAINLYKSEGFKKEGLLRECILYNGNFDSLVVMSILKKEYKQPSIEELIFEP